MKKKVRVYRILLGLTGILIGAGMVGAYLYIKNTLPKVPELAQQSLAEKGIHLRYRQSENDGLKIRLSEVEIEGAPLPYQLKASAFSLSVELALGFPFVKVALHAEQPLLFDIAPPPKPADTPTTSPPSEPLTLPIYAGAALALVALEARVTNGNFTPIGVEGVNATLGIHGLNVTDTGIPTANFRYWAQARKIAALSWMSDLEVTGEAAFDGDQIDVSESELALGPLRIETSGRYRLADHQWSGSLLIPTTELSRSSDNINYESIDWLGSVSGELGLDVQFRGATQMENNERRFSLSYAEGKIIANNVSLQLSRSDLKGAVRIDAKGNFLKEKNTQLDLSLQCDLTSAEMLQADLFRKPKGIPARFELALEGEANQINIKKGLAQFHTLTLNAGGNFTATQDPMASLKFQIPKTDLAGWQRFFPSYQEVKTKGSISGSGSYEGPLQNWQAAKLTMNLDADRIRFPILPGWIPNKDTRVNGVAELHSQTKIDYTRGTLKKLDTNTTIDLSRADIRYADLFQKRKGVAARAQMRILSSEKMAVIKRGLVTLGKSRTKISGSIRNPSNPTAKIAFATGTVALPTMLPLLPTLKSYPVSKIKGAISANGSIQGPLLEGPKIKGKIKLKRVRLAYQGPSKLIQLKKADGTIAFTDRSLSSRRLFLNFPKTNAYTSFRFTDFTEPKVQFNFESKQFSADDFYDTKAVPGGPISVAAVPVSNLKKATKSQPGTAVSTKDDFRKNPYVAKSTVNGKILLRKADLGWTKAKNVRAQIRYANLKLNVDPISMELMGGTLSAKTAWNGNPEQPTTVFDLNVNNVDANRFITSCSPKYRDILHGKLNTTGQFNFSGLDAQEIKKTVTGKGNYALKEGELKTLRFSKGPLDQLRKIPGLKNSIKQTSFTERVQNSTGSFTLENGKLNLSNLIVRTPYFNLTGNDLSVDFNQNLLAKLNWEPKPNLLAPNVLNALKNAKGKPSVPLSLSGPLRSPAVKIDNAFQKQMATVGAQALKNQLLKSKEIKNLEQQGKQLLKGLFK